MKQRSYNTLLLLYLLSHLEENFLCSLAIVNNLKIYFTTKFKFILFGLIRFITNKINCYNQP